MSRLRAEGVRLLLGGHLVLDDVSVDLEPGRFVGLIGPNGAGKTSLLQVLAGLRRPDRGIVCADGRRLLALPRRKLARLLAYLPQRGAVHWPLTVRRLVLLGRLPHGSPWAGVSATDRAAVDRTMHRVGISHLAERPLSSLSGGEAARALIARALAVEAPILIADEPVAALDPYQQLQIMELLRSEAGAGKIVLAVLHDLALASRFCDRLILLSAGRVLADGPVEAVLTTDAVARAYSVETWEGGPDGDRFVIPWRRLGAQADLNPTRSEPGRNPHG